jgi:hypothetical protein
MGGLELETAWIVQREEAGSLGVKIVARESKPDPELDLVVGLKSPRSGRAKCWSSRDQAAPGKSHLVVALFCHRP